MPLNEDIEYLLSVRASHPTASYFDLPGFIQDVV